MNSRLQRGRLGAPVLRLVVSALLVAAVAETSVLSQAASPGPGALGDLGISVEPARGVTASPWLVYEVDQGASISDDVIVANDSSQARSLDVYGADARTLPSGAFAADLQQVRPSELGAWTKLDLAHVELLPHTSQRVHLGVAVPGGTDAGEYAGSILVQFVTADNLQVRIVHRIGLRVYLTVKGSVVESGQIDSVTSGHWWERGWPDDMAVLRTTFVNTGRVHLKLSGAASAEESAAPLNDTGRQRVVPRNSRLELVTPWRSHPWIGMQRVSVDVLYTNRESAHAVAATNVWFIPWKALLLVLALLTLFIYIARRLVIWVRRSRVAVNVLGATMRMTVVDPGDHPEGLPDAPKGSELIVVALQVLNKGSKPFRFVLGRFQLLDEQNRTFAADSAASARLEEEPDRLVPPGGREVFALAFVLPQGIRPRAGIYKADAGRLIAEMVPW